MKENTMLFFFVPTEILSRSRLSFAAGIADTTTWLGVFPAHNLDTDDADLNACRGS